MAQTIIFTDDKQDSFVTELSKRLKLSKHETIRYLIDQAIKRGRGDATRD